MVAAKRTTESSTLASSSLRTVVVSTTSSTALSAAQRPEKRPRRQDGDEARPAASEFSEVIGGARTRPLEVEVLESSCLGSVLESNVACSEQLVDHAETTDYSLACGELTQSNAEEVLSHERHAPFVRKGSLVWLDLFCANVLLNMNAMVGPFASAHRVFDGFPVRAWCLSLRFSGLFAAWGV